MKQAYTTLKTKLEKKDYFSLIQMALQEDHAHQDITTLSVFDQEHTTKAFIVCRQPALLAGLEIAKESFLAFDKSLKIELLKKDGESLQTGDQVLQVTGKTISILSSERVALNFLSLVCGWATAAQTAVQETSPSRITLLDTRKTLPGFREISKYAMFVGGVINHRGHLADMGLLKDNHLAHLSISQAVESFRKKFPNKKLEVEVENEQQLQEALLSGADMILLDNMSASEIEKSCQAIQEHNQKYQTNILSEASGNLTAEKISSIKDSGLDYASMGRLTAHAQPIDFGLDII